MLENSASFFQNSYTQSSRIIHTPSVFARSSLLYLQEVGELTALYPHVSSRQSLSSYLFFVVTRGSGTLEYKGNTYELKAGDCVFIDCREGYSQQTSAHRGPDGRFDELWSLSWVHFDGATMSSIYNKYRERGGKAVFRAPYTEPKIGEEQPLSSSGWNRYADLIKKIFSIVSSDSYVRDMQIAEKLTALLTCLMEDAWEQENRDVHAAPKRRLVRDVKEYIDANYRQTMSLKLLAERFYINKEYLSHIFKDTYGYTVNGYIAHVRVARAKELLRFTDKAVYEIGAEVGMPELNYFSRVFKKVEGTTPSKYRESW